MRPYLSYLLFIVALLFFCTGVKAQQVQSTIPLKKIVPNSKEAPKKRTDTVIVEKGTPQKDLSDVLMEAMHAQPPAAQDSIGAKPQVSIVPAVGYTLVSGFAVVLSGNVAFRTGPMSRISTIVASASYTQKKQIIIPVQTNFWTHDNNYELIGNYDFLKYPQDTYGLGSNSKISAEDPMNYSLIQLYETVLRRITGNFFAGAGFDFDDHYNVSEKGNKNGQVSDYANYGTSASSVSSGFTLNAVYDSRDNSINPFKGAYIGLQLRSADKAFGSTSEWQSVILDMRKYFNFPEGSGNVLALWNYDWLIVSGKPPYLDLPATGWDANWATGRGYIQGRFRGAQMVYFEGEYRFRITANGLIGGTVFLNGETFSAQQGTRLESIQPGFGPGLRIKLNKVSKTNISINYGFGSEGSKGLFISVGEAF
jgi:hypothetical protein